MTKTLIVSGNSPAPAGAYSPALAGDGWLSLSGQGGFDPASGELVSGGIEAHQSAPRSARRSSAKCSSR